MAARPQGIVNHRFTLKIIFAMILGLLVGLAIRFLPISDQAHHFLSTNILETAGQIFLRLIQLLVVPVVFTSIVCGTATLGGGEKIGMIGLKTISLYILTTVIAITVALTVAALFHVGKGLDLQGAAQFKIEAPASWKHLILSIFPKNPFKALAEGNLLQIILFALLFGVALGISKEKAKSVFAFFNGANEVLMRLILLIMRLAPYGVFCLLANLFSKIGFEAIAHLGEYFILVVLCLALQLFCTYAFLLYFFAKTSIWHFLKEMYSVLLFAFSVSSSNASIPVTMQAVKNRLKVKPAIASFVVPLGATINMDGTAIMQGVATVFIANAYAIHLGLMQYITVIVMATLSSIGTAGVPSIGMITLAMVLEQVGIPVEGIALIIGIDRILDMTRTAVNVAGDATVSCVIDYSESR